MPLQAQTQSILPDVPSPAPYATLPAESRGRLHEEPESPTRSCFQRDRDRIIHSAAFRRLEYKTQVFVNHEGDHYRTRLTHSLEVSQITRSIARSLGANEDLAEALALAHDLGHTPFGHAGEDALSESMTSYGGFDHNAHTLRLITRLEQRYAAFDGLNLTWETLEGIAKHNGPVTETPLPRELAEYNKKHDLELYTHAGIEAQIAALADDIAYHNHDIDDGFRADILTREDFEEVPEVSAVFAEVEKQYPNIATARVVHEVNRRLINRMCTDVLATTMKNIRESGVASADAVRELGRPLVAFSPEMEQVSRSLKALLMQKMYRHYKVNRMTSKAHHVIKDLFDYFMRQPDCLPAEWYASAKGKDKMVRAQVVSDFIAGMTDRFALQEHQKIFDVWAKN